MSELELMKTVSEVLAAKPGKKWASQGIPVLIEVNREIKKIEGSKEEEQAPWKALIQESTDKYALALKPLAEMNKRLRERVLKEVEGTETIEIPEKGSVQFPQKWGYEVEDMARVPKEYRVEVLDTKKINEAIKKGLRTIKGLKIGPQRSLRVVTGSGDKE